MTDRPFDDIRDLIAQAPPAAAASPTAPPDLGQLGAIADWIAAWRGKPKMSRPILALYAGAHAGGNVAAARTFLEQVAAGQAGVSLAAQHLGAGLDVYDLAMDRPLPSSGGGPKMSERECAATMAFGMDVLAKQPDLLILVGIGPGSDAAASAVIEGLASLDDPLDILRRVGGRETAAIVGAIIAARTQRIPVLLDGLPALAALAVLEALDPTAVDHCRLIGASEVPGTFAPFTDLGVARADGTAALAALSVIKLACAIADTAT